MLLLPLSLGFRMRATVVSGYAVVALPNSRDSSSLGPDRRTLWTITACCSAGEGEGSWSGSRPPMPAASAAASAAAHCAASKLLVLSREPGLCVTSSSMLSRGLRVKPTGRAGTPPAVPCPGAAAAAGPEAPSALSAAAAAAATAAADTEDDLRLRAADTLTAAEAAGQKVEGQQWPATVNAGSRQLSAGQAGSAAGQARRVGAPACAAACRFAAVIG